MTKKEGKAPDLVEAAVVVPGGVRRLMKLDDTGYFVIRLSGLPITQIITVMSGSRYRSFYFGSKLHNYLTPGALGLYNTYKI